MLYELKSIYSILVNFSYPWTPEWSEVQNKLPVKVPARNLCCLKCMKYDPFKRFLILEYGISWSAISKLPAGKSRLNLRFMNLKLTDDWWLIFELKADWWLMTDDWWLMTDDWWLIFELKADWWLMTENFQWKFFDIFKVTSILCPKVALHPRWISNTDSVPLNPL